MKIIILGSKGFIGGHLLRLLKKTRHEVFPFSRETVDLLDGGAVKREFRRVRPDAVINCAAHTGSGRYVNTHAAEVFADNVQMSLNLYRAVQYGCPKARIINLISNCSYPGDQGIQKEGGWLQGPVHDSIAAYGNAKRTLYYTAVAFSKEYGITSINLIIPEVYGPGDHIDPAHTHATDGMVIRMLKAKRAGAKEFVIWGTGKPVRETIFVKDVAAAILLSLTRREERLYPINIGQGRGHSIMQTARAIKTALHFPGKLVCDPSRQDGAPKKVLSNRRFKKAFPHFSFTDFRVGIRNAIAYYEAVL